MRDGEDWGGEERWREGRRDGGAGEGRRDGGEGVGRRDGGEGAGSVAGSLEDSVYSDMVGGLCRSTGLVPSFIWEENRGAGV